MRYHTIIFDIDGTLLDSEYANLHALQDTLLERTGRQMPIESLAFALGLDGYFAAVVCADDTPAHKPDPAPLLECLARLGAGQSEALYVGDSVYDSLCAQRAGVDFALALWGCRGPRPPAAHLPAAPGDLLRLAGSR